MAVLDWIALILCVLASFDNHVGRVGAVDIGVCHGRQGNDLPAATDVINLYKKHGIAKIRLFEPNHAELDALKGSGIGQAAVDIWFNDNVAPYINDGNINYIAVGNEPDLPGLSSDNSGPYEHWLEQDSSVICMITNTLYADALTLVIGCQTSKEVWATLKQRYGSISEYHIMQLKSNLHNIHKGSDSIEKYLLRFKSVRDQLTTVGVRMSDQDMKILFLAGLPSEYGHTRQVIGRI
ncbi:glucan endo-1,3-beta-glucosidase 6 [Rosa chinensis]|uniref:glucan endo-1,3-beta-glucosidase 6 n=1 Tax=Rosa chinensis TaxID=74649 RepID=UPI000D08F265|nr:glucan endo-1,3-beta-glucosidase 6 [Rosa chinensis]